MSGEWLWPLYVSILRTDPYTDPYTVRAKSSLRVTASMSCLRTAGAKVLRAEVFMGGGNQGSKGMRLDRSHAWAAAES